MHFKMIFGKKAKQTDVPPIYDKHNIKLLMTCLKTDIIINNGSRNAKKKKNALMYVVVCNDMS